MFRRIIREVLLGPTYFYHKYLIKKSKKWTKKEINEYQKEKEKNITDVIITKKEINSNLKKFTKKNLLIPLKRVRTGGTTGEPLFFFQDIFFSRQKERAYMFEVWRKIGYKPFDYRIVVRGNNPNKGISYNFFENALIISQNAFTSEMKNELFSIFIKKPYYLHVYPSTLIFLIDYWGKEVFKDFPILGILAGSESFPLSQLKWFEKSFNIPLAHWYGHSEYAVFAEFCEKCKEFHFYPTYGKVCLNKNGKHYRLIANSFNRYGTQFINYFTGDYAIPSKRHCDENNFFKVNTIIGREQEFIFDIQGHKKAFGPYLFGIHSDFWEHIEKIQFVQNEAGKLYVYYIPTSKYQEYSFRNFLINRFKGFTLIFSEVNSTKTTKSGKHKFIIQNLKI